MKLAKTTRPDSGFALVVTLMLMILLTIIAVGLLSLSSISLRSSGAGSSAATARSNARMALMLALGELQKEMGPDTRISAPQEQDAVKANTGGQPRWTASYDAWKRPTTGAETPASRVPTFRSWLVSGMSPPSTGKPIPLLGTGTLGTEAPATDRISVPSVTVKNTQTSNTIAWWISDEGVKAKINAGPDTIATTAPDPLVQTQSPQNIGHKTIPALASFDWSTGKRAKTISNAQVNLAAGLSNTDSKKGIGSTFHDVTVASEGVLADVRGGRLKRDLSNLLSRPVNAVENKPLYLADGTMNAYTIGADGSFENNAAITSAWNTGYNKPTQWGINMEELYLFYNLPREVSWAGGGPSLVMKSSREQVVNDRHYIYRRPVVQAMQGIFSLKAVPDTAAGRYKMEMHMDGLVALSNPNDIPVTFSAGLNTPFFIQNMPYSLTWQNTNSAGTTLTGSQNGVPVDPLTGSTLDNRTFRGYVGGKPQAGFTLRAGEAGVFGSGSSVGYESNLSRGFTPNGGVTLANRDMKASNLLGTDKINFKLTRKTGNQNGPNFSAWLGDRVTEAPTKGWQMDQWNLTGDMSAGGTVMNSYLPLSITSPGATDVNEFLQPKPILVVSFFKNVEKVTTASFPDAFASRPFQLTETALCGHLTSVTRLEKDQHGIQTIFSAKGLNYTWESLAGGNGGADFFIGGAHDPNFGGSNIQIQRRIPFAAPLSIGAFQHAIASGFCDHFYENTLRTGIGGTGLAVGADPLPTTSGAAGALTGNVHALPLVSKAIGNSHSLPNLALGEVYRSGADVSVARVTANGSAPGSGAVATDHSWMVNTALWDSWYLSSIVDSTTSTAPASWQPDSRSAKAQFQDLADSTGQLRNRRYLYYPYKNSTEAVSALFSGTAPKDSAINDLSKYLLVDGAFNVNSASIPAWTAFLSSIRDQSIKTGNGSTAFDHPLGTLGYAANSATSGTAGEWAGLRNLSTTEIETLAGKIVDEVKARGPFLSMADFVNRRPNSSTKAHQLLGALQSAIDLSGLNDRFKTGNHAVVTAAEFQGYPGSIKDEPVPTRALGAAGYLTQGDLLTAFGSQIAVRSDTFIIRSYGDARDPAGKIMATAWCEAVVQRVPEYVDPIDAPEAQAGWPTVSSTLAPANVYFGRRFVIRSFRWLNQNEI